MAHNTTAATNRRKLATPSSNHKIPSMDSNSTHKKHIPELTKLFTSLHTTTKDQTHMPVTVSAMADPDVQTHKKPSKKPSKKGSVDPQEIVKLHYPIKEENDEIKRLSSGAIVKIKELKVSCDGDGDGMEQHDCKKRPSMEGQRRRSITISGSNNKVEISDFLSSNGARIVSADMPPFMQIHAVGCARKVCDSLEKFTSKALALTIKKEFDGVYGPAWHCIVGSSFGSFVTHSVGGFLYFSLDHKLYVLLFKTSVQKAD